LVAYFARQCIEAALAAGRKREDIQIMAAAPVWVGEREKCRAQTRWFPGMVGNHVADIVARYGADCADIPQRLTAYIEQRKGYDYKDHANKDADHLDFVTDEIIDAFSILGSVDEHIAKLKELEAAGVDQFALYLMCGDEERILTEYCEKILPHFAQGKAQS
jgi:alkanesulfonate monooxygenase SsuD/methylene tetrahydromethanopterin reductase-like flavin-dependent oxidoreductase (luciferase family)